MTKHIFYTDVHAKPGTDNRRADWLGKLIVAEKPDHVIQNGDLWDMDSLSSYDKGKPSFVGRSYEKDVEVGVEFNDRTFKPVKRQKKKEPEKHAIIGNHEYRLKRALDMNPEYEGSGLGISFKDYQLEDYFDTVTHYDGNTPGILEIDGINYAHFIASGAMGRPIGGDNHARHLCDKTGKSCAVGHSHMLSYYSKAHLDGSRINGLVGGMYCEEPTVYAGATNKQWWRGVCILDNVEDGNYDLRLVSLESLRKEYG